MYAIGVDIGGTGVKTGIVDEKGKILKKSYIPTSKSHDYRTIVEDIAKQISALFTEANLKEEDFCGIGIGCPGAVNSKKGTVDYSNNLEWENVPLVSELNKYFRLPIKVSNDANVAALGETVFGAGKKYSDTVLITLGTGVGGGIVIDNQLFEGNESKGAELGHTVIVRNGEECTCGRKGCLEAYASATALIRDTKRAMQQDKSSMMWEFCSNDIDKVDGRTSFECAKQGDKSAKSVVENYIESLGEGIVNFVNVFRPQAIILGGGVCAQGEYLTKPLEKYVEKYAYGGEHAPKVEIVIASLGNDAGIIGASALIR